MTTARWVHKHRETLGKRMTRIDFEQFMEKTGVTVEGLSRVLDYTVHGIEKMLERGSAKNETVRLLQKNFPTITKFVNMEDYQKNEGTK